MARGINIPNDSDLNNINIIDQSLSNESPNINRAYQRSKEASNYKAETVTILDIDTAILKYLEKINVTVDVGGMKRQVPVVYGDAEKWQQATRNGMIRDNNGQVQLPLIMLRRTNIQRQDGITRKLNQSERIVYTTGYSSKNKFDRYSRQIGLNPTQEIYKVRLGDFVQMEYECIIWTDFVTHANQIIEQLNWNSDEYWGMDTGPKFKSIIDVFNTNMEISDQGERFVKTNFSLLVKGYILSDKIDDTENDEEVIRSYTTKKTVVFQETVKDINDIITKPKSIEAYYDETIFSFGGQFVEVPGGGDSAEYQDVLSYISYVVTQEADSITPSTATFLNTQVKPAPVVDYLTFSDDSLFQIFVNGVYIPPDVWSYNQVGNDLVFSFNTSLLGYSLNAGDVVAGIGKFETI